MNADNITLCNWGECCAVRPDPNGGVWLSSTRRPGVEVLLDADEWASFLARCEGGGARPKPAGECDSATGGRPALKIDNEGETA